jgi:hypothetical protein
MRDIPWEEREAFYRRGVFSQFHVEDADLLFEEPSRTPGASKVLSKRIL